MNELFQALGDPTRREILRLLSAGDLSAGEIAERFPLAKSTLSGHFNVLKHAGLIVSEKKWHHDRVQLESVGGRAGDGGLAEFVRL